MIEHFKLIPCAGRRQPPQPYLWDGQMLRQLSIKWMSYQRGCVLSTTTTTPTPSPLPPLPFSSDTAHYQVSIFLRREWACLEPVRAQVCFRLRLILWLQALCCLLIPFFFFFFFGANVHVCFYFATYESNVIQAARNNKREKMSWAFCWVPSNWANALRSRPGSIYYPINF